MMHSNIFLRLLCCTLYTLNIILCTTFVKHNFCTLYNFNIYFFNYVVYNLI
nr:MAG TPA: hypothetical protein [Caudoviricetes sp.]